MSTRCVILIGMMGAGKSEVGEDLAANLGYQFADSDNLIQELSGKSINKIFQEDGEEAFRQLERDAIQGLEKTRSHVIAVGGGAVMDPDSRRLLKSLGQVIYLKASPSELYARVKNAKNRPLLQTEDPKGRMRSLLAERSSTYEEMADFIVDTEDISVPEVVDRIIDELARRTVETQGDW